MYAEFTIYTENLYSTPYYKNVVVFINLIFQESGEISFL